MREVSTKIERPREDLMNDQTKSVVASLLATVTALLPNL